MKRIWMMGCALGLLALARCAPGATGTPLPRASDTPVPPAVAAKPSSTPPPSFDTRFGAVFFGDRLNTADLPCEALKELRIRSTFFGAWWGQLEPQPGQYDWASVDTPVDAALACDIEPVIKITTAIGPGQDGTPPQDMDAYARFVFELAQHLRGRVRAYAIENEVNNARMVWTAEAYGPLRAAAYEAIKRADPGATVLDSGLTMQAYILGRANELLQAGQTQAAIAMLDRFYSGMRRKENKPNLPTTEQDLVAWLGHSDNPRNLSLLAELYAHPETFDAVQLHYLQDAWELLPEYVGWVRAWLNDAGTPDKPIEFWEIGFGWEGAEFTEESHAAGVVKTLVIALGEGAGRAIYEPYTESGGEAEAATTSPKFGRGLVTSSGPRLASTAYRTMTGRLSGYQRAERLPLGSDVWVYRFETPQGDVYVAWAADSTTVHLPLTVAQVTVTDVSDNETVADPAALPVGPSPVFVTTP